MNVVIDDQALEILAAMGTDPLDAPRNVPARRSVRLRRPVA